MPDTSIYTDSRTWEVILFFVKSLFAGILLIGTIYLLEKSIFKKNEESSKRTDFIVYIVKSILYIFLVFLLAAIFGYQYLVMGILLVVLIFMLFAYSIPMGISKIRTRQLEKNYSLEMKIFAVAKEKGMNWGELKKNLIDRVSNYEGLTSTKIKPRIGIMDRLKASEEEEKELILVWLELWMKKESNNAKKSDLIGEFIHENSDLLTLEEFDNHKFHVEQSNNTTNRNA